MNTVIQVENLSKSFKIFKRKDGIINSINSIFNRDYKYKKVVNNISFTVNKGEIIGFLGPNGAGKSTTIKMLTGILVPTKGKVIVNGMVPYRDRIKNSKNIGVVFGQRTQLWWDIPVKESLELMKVMYNISDEEFKERLDLFDDILNIYQFIDIPVRQLSLGQRMAADLCCAFLHSPEIVYLDEPTIGLDVVVKKKVREFIKEINKTQNTTIVLTTHDITDIEFLCDRVIVIDNGNIIYNGMLDTLKETYSNIGRICFKINNPAINIDEIRYLLEDSIINLVVEENNIIIDYKKSEIMSSSIIQVIIEKFIVYDISFTYKTLEEIIREIYVNGI